MNSNVKTIMAQYQNQRVNEQTKIREILQQTALLGLERTGFFEKAAFYGGTALRILYDLNRFSEDLDFTLLNPDPQFDFSPFLEGMRKELASFGFEMEVTKKSKNIETSVVSAFMKMNTIKLYLAIGDEQKSKSINHNEKIQIKLEVDTDPPSHFRLENRVVSNPMTFHVLTLHPSDLFAGKVHAILYRAWKGRVKGRDWYDLIWYLQKSIPLGMKYLESCMRQAGNWNRDEPLGEDYVLELIKNKISHLDWEGAKEDVKAFIPDPQVLNIWSPSFFLEMIQRIKFEK